MLTQGAPGWRPGAGPAQSSSVPLGAQAPSAATLRSPAAPVLGEPDARLAPATAALPRARDERRSQWSPPPDSPGQASGRGAPSARGAAALPNGAAAANGPAPSGGGPDAAAAGLAAAAAAAAAAQGGGGDAGEAMAAVEASLARLVDAIGPEQEVWYYLDPQARRRGGRPFLPYPNPVLAHARGDQP